MGWLWKTKKNVALELVNNLNASSTPADKKMAAKGIVAFANKGFIYREALKHHDSELPILSFAFAGRNGKNPVEDFWILWCMMSLWTFSEFDTNLSMQNAFCEYEGFNDPNDSELASHFSKISTTEQIGLNTERTDSTTGDISACYNLCGTGGDECSD